MIRINLLPHREAARKERREQFFVLAGLIFVLAVLVVFAVFTLIDGLVGTQAGRNNYLKQEIAQLDKQLEQIKRLKEQSQALLARKRVIEDLQRDRGETVYLLGELTRQVPEEIGRAHV
jgi:type IV pilus assembly protein PilN